MVVRFLQNRDFQAGLMLICFGAAAMIISQDYGFGSASRMGPGFFPTILCGILIVFGVCVTATDLHSGKRITRLIHPRSMILPSLALVMFRIAIDRAGFIPALMVLIFVAAASGSEFCFLEVLPLALVLVFAAVVLFIFRNETGV